MSVINQMLRDLEQRRVETPDPVDGALHDLAWPGTAQARRPRRLTLLVWALIGIVLVLTIAVLLWDRALLTAQTPAPLAQAPTPVIDSALVPVMPQIQAPAIIPAAPPEAQTPAMSEPPAAPLSEQPPVVAVVDDTTRVEAIRTNITAQKTQLVFELSAAVEYRLARDNPQQLILELDNTRLANPDAAVDTSHSLLSAIRSEPLDENSVRVILEAHQPLRVKDHLLQPDQARGHRLVIDLYPAMAARAPATAEHTVQNTVAERALPADPAAQATPAPAAPVVATPAAVVISKTAPAQSAAQLAEASYQEAIRHLTSGQLAAGETQLRKALSADSGHINARQTLATTLMKAERLGEAQDLLVEGIRQNPQHAPFTMLYARLLVAQGKPIEALTALERLPSSAQDAADYHAFLGALYQQLERHQLALGAYREALTRQPQQGLWWMGLGISLEATGQTAEALAAYQNALASRTLHNAPLDYVQEKIAALKLQVK